MCEQVERTKERGTKRKSTHTNSEMMASMKFELLKSSAQCGHIGLQRAHESVCTLESGSVRF